MVMRLLHRIVTTTTSKDHKPTGHAHTHANGHMGKQTKSFASHLEHPIRHRLLAPVHVQLAEAQPPEEGEEGLVRGGLGDGWRII